MTRSYVNFLEGQIGRLSFLYAAVLLLTSFKQHLEITPKQGVDLSLGPGFAYGRF